MVDDQNTASGVTFIVMSVIQFSLCAWIFQRRERQPIKARRAWLMLMPAFCYVFRYIVSSTKYLAAETTLCAPYFIFLHTLAWTGLLSFTVRMWFLYHAFIFGKRSLSSQSAKKKLMAKSSNLRSPSVQSEQSNPASREVSSGEIISKLSSPSDFTLDDVALHVERSRLLVMKRKLSNKYLAGIICAGGLTFFLVETIYFFSQPEAALSLRISPLCLKKADIPVAFFTLLSFIWLFVCLEFLRRLRKVDDFFMISAEFRLCVVQTFPCLLGLIWGLSNLSSANAVFISDWILSASIFSFFVVSSGYVLALSYQRRFQLDSLHKRTTSNQHSENAVTSAVASNVSDFRLLLENLAGVEIFQQHLLKELSVENIMFWNAVNEFKLFASECSEVEFIKKSAQSMFDTYISESAPFQVNISSEQNSFIENQLKPTFADISKLRELFDGAQKEVFFLMARDSFQRFKHTEVYQQWRKKAQVDTSGNLASLELV
jgi:regulator of G-protein signaling